MVRRMRTLLCLLACIACTLAAGEEPLKPGFNNNLKAGGFSWNAYVVDFRTFELI
jgi:hypothetical protein